MLDKLKGFFQATKSFFQVKRNVILVSTTILIASIVGTYVYINKKTDQLKVIPKDAHAVLIIDLPSLIKKGDLKAISETKDFKKWKKELEEESKDDGDSDIEIINDFKDDPSISGINFLTEAIAFCYSDEDEFYGCLTFSVDNEEKFIEFIEDFGDEVLQLDFDVVEEIIITMQ